MSSKISRDNTKFNKKEMEVLVYEPIRRNCDNEDQQEKANKNNITKKFTGLLNRGKLRTIKQISSH